MIDRLIENIRGFILRIWFGTDLLRLINRILRMFVVPTPRGKGGKLNVSLGCGKVAHAEFINVDWFPYSHVHYVRKIDRLPWFKDNSVDLLYASHCLEHFRYLDTENVLAEWFRVLKPGGILRVSVPDIEKLVEIYKCNDNDPDFILPQLFGGEETPVNFHYTALNSVNLSRLFRKVGFREVREWRPGEDGVLCCPDMSTYQKKIGNKEYPVCLNLEAEK